MKTLTQATAPKPPPLPNGDDYRSVLAKHARAGNLLAFTLFCDPRFDVAPFHRNLCEFLREAIVRGHKRRIILSAPPRHGKTRLAVEELAALFLGLHPDKALILACHGQKLATRASKNVRRRVQSVQYQTLFPKTEIRPDEAGAEFWSTTRGGSFQAVGIGTGLSGFDASLLIIDDLFPDRAAAESKTARDATWDWYASTAYTRLMPDGAVIVCGTRWHKDDLAGRLLDKDTQRELKESGNEEEVFFRQNYAAFSEGHDDPLKRPFGEELWPSRWNKKRMNARRARVGSYEWNSLYQGNPIDKEGNAALVAMIRWIDLADVPKDLELPRAWDLAVGEKDSNDFSAGVRGGYDKRTECFYIVHMKRQRTRWLTTKASIVSLGEQELNRIRLEAVSAFAALAEEVMVATRGKNIISTNVPRMDKVTRALPWLTALEAGRVFVVRGEWNADFVDELGSFPNGKHDDQIDAVTELWEMTSKKSTITFA